MWFKFTYVENFYSKIYNFLKYKKNKNIFKEFLFTVLISFLISVFYSFQFDDLSVSNSRGFLNSKTSSPSNHIISSKSNYYNFYNFKFYLILKFKFEVHF